MNRIKVTLLIIFLLLVSCDDGLSPEFADEKPGFGGTISFIGDWDPTISETHVVVFRDPLLSESDFNVFNLSFVSETIPNGSSTYEYSTNDESSLVSTITSATYSYIAVAQSIKDTITLNREDWFIIGLYNMGNVELDNTTFLNGIDILCNFNNPPPQPPGGSELFNKIISSSSFIKLRGNLIE